MRRSYLGKTKTRSSRRHVPVVDALLPILEDWQRRWATCKEHEVEAALDDTNLRRFVTFVDTMRAHTQFVVVTHQRRTMEMADVLYGVSMQADGVSKVVSQRLERDGATEAEDDHALV